jgi:23S rRNA pseudouridine1911/1915/1917 synthase
MMLVVPKEARGARLDRFLFSALAALPRAPSRAEIQRWIDNDRVQINGRSVKSGARLSEGQQVSVEPESAPLSAAVPELGVVFDVLYVDADLVVLVKPAGLVVHPAKGHETGTLVHGLLGRGLFDVENFASADGAEPNEVTDRVRPGIVHRLDKGTSGVMVVARTLFAQRVLKEQFAAHTIERAYECICLGDLAPQSFETLHGRNPQDRMKFTSRVRSGKRAVTHVLPLERFAVATHAECRLETGRTHQIRMHLSEHGHSILGDPLYGKPPKSPVLRALADRLGHQALHARTLGLDHPQTGKRMRWEASPPADFQVVLQSLRMLPS